MASQQLPVQAVLLDLSSQLPLKQLSGLEAENVQGTEGTSYLTWMGSSHCSGEMISLFESVDKDGNGMLDEAKVLLYLCLSASFESQPSINLPSSGVPNG